MADKMDQAPRSRKISDSAVGEITDTTILIETKSETIKVDISDVENCSLWIFGYGSLVWKPNFEYHSQLVGHIDGYKRRFWQGNTYHRGSAQNIARVATLIPQPTLDDNNNPEVLDKITDPEGEEPDAQEYTTWGVAFQLLGKQQILEAINHLNMRETQLGGYDIVMTDFYSKIAEPEGTPPSIKAMVFMATVVNPIYLGPASSMKMSQEICVASGVCGTNVEYLLKLCAWQKSYVPKVKDTHLMNLETHCLYIMKELIEEQQNVRCSSPARQPEGTNWLKENWVKSYIDLRQIGSNIKCTCHESTVHNPKDFFGKFGPHYI